jgi:HEAT repeat protein
LRILEVIDTVTRDLKTELAFTLESEKPELREAGFQLAERLNNPQVVELLLNYARSPNAGLAIDAIKYLGRLKSQTALEVLVPLLNDTHDTKLMMACCQALGQIGEPACVEPLVNILKGKRSLFRRKRRSPQIRATAAFALAQIPHPRVAEILAPFVDDDDLRVKEIARNRAYAASPPSAEGK